MNEWHYVIFVFVTRFTLMITGSICVVVNCTNSYGCVLFTKLANSSLKSGARICRLHLTDLGVMSGALGYPLILVLLFSSSCPQQVSRGCLAGAAVKAVSGNSLNQKRQLKAGGLSLTFQIFDLHTIFRKFWISCQHKLQGQKTDQWFARVWGRPGKGKFKGVGVVVV